MSDAVIPGIHFLETVVAVSEIIGVFAADLFSKDEEAKQFYLKYGSRELQDDPLHLYLPIATPNSCHAEMIRG